MSSQRRKMNIVTTIDFERQYMSAVPPVLKSSGNPIQIYDIQETARFIQLPTPLHRPDYNFIVHLTRGTAKQQVDAEIMSISKHDILLVKQGNMTALKEVSEDAAGHIILFEDSTLHHLLSKEKFIHLFTANSVIPLSEETSQWLTPLFGLLSNEMNSEKPDLDISYSLFQAALIKIIASNKAQHQTISRSSEVAFSFKELVYKYHIEHKSVSFYVDKLSVSVNYLNRCIQQTMGTAPKEWINKVSISQSQLLLQDFTKCISSVAFELNYEDPSYFGRLFKKVTRLTPSEYRASIMQNSSG